MGTQPCRSSFRKETWALFCCHQCCPRLRWAFWKHRTFTARRNYRLRVRLKCSIKCMWLTHLLRPEVIGHKERLSRAQPIPVHCETPFTHSSALQTTHSAIRRCIQIVFKLQSDRKTRQFCDNEVSHSYCSRLDGDPCMFEGSRPYGPGTVQTGKEFKGLRIINSLKRGKEIIFTAPGAHWAQSPCSWWAMKIQPLREKYSFKNNDTR